MTTGCPYKDRDPMIGEMFGYYNDWSLGIHPVNTGRAPWLTSPFIQAMHHIRRVNAMVDDEKMEAEREKRFRGGH